VATAVRYDSTHRRPAERYVQRNGQLSRTAGDSAATPGDATSEVTVLRDSANRPLRVDLSPIDPGGDGAVTYSYFFDDSARVRVVDVRGAFFHNSCADLLKAKRRVIYDARGDSVGGEETLTDGEGAPKTRAACSVPDAISPPKYRTYAELVRAGVAPQR
jgi:hypothetical protein